MTECHFYKKGTLKSCFVLVISRVFSEEIFVVCLLHFRFAFLQLHKFLSFPIFLVLNFLRQTTFPDKVAILRNTCLPDYFHVAPWQSLPQNLMRGATAQFLSI